MNRYTSEEAIVKSITVRCNPDTAFRIWTEGISTWWPKGHSLSGRSDIEVFIEAGVGGRYYERTSDGAEYDWGEVLVWEPPHRLAYSWYLGSGPERPTRVDVSFVAESEESTRVEVVHRGPELIGELWHQRKDSFQSSWQTVLSSFLSACRLEAF